MQKRKLENHHSCSLHKTPDIRKIRKIGKVPKVALSPCKILTLGQKLKFQKHVKIHSTNHSQLFSAKDPSKKHQIFQKWDRFKNRESRKDYSPCRIITLGQKLKLQKTFQNPFYKSFRVVLCKKTLKKHQIFQKWDCFENRPSSKGYSPWKIITLGRKLKFQKTGLKSIL